LTVARSYSFLGNTTASDGWEAALDSGLTWLTALK
jgi:hypothetical protein